MPTKSQTGEMPPCRDDHSSADGKILAGRHPAVRSRLQDAKHHKDESGGRKDRSDDIEFRSGTLYPRIIDATAEHHDQDHNQDLQDERRAPADRQW